MAAQYQMVDVDQIHPHPSNARQGDTGAICESIKANGFYRPIVVQRSTGNILAGNHAHRAAVMSGMDQVPVAWLDCDNETALRILLVDNRTNDLASYDYSALAEVLTSVISDFGDLDGTGYDREDLDQIIADLGDATIGLTPQVAEATPNASLADRFGVPPFSVLDARQGYWQARKASWLALGIQSELGRGGGVNSQSKMSLELAGGFQNHPAHRGMNLSGEGATACPGGSPRPACDYSQRQRGDGSGRPLNG